MPRRACVPALVPALVLALVAGVLGTLALTTVASSAVDFDCGDFATQKAAQTWYVDHGGPRLDPARLDSDGDGIACESNPCPCSTSRTSSGGTSTVAPLPGTVVRSRGHLAKVVDGDTVDVRLASGVLRRVRLIGIDTPEVYGGLECGGRQASDALRRALPPGTRVRLVSDPSQDLRDRYGRLLRYVVRAHDGRDMNRTQVRAGWATVYVYARTPFRRVTSYRDAQRAARTAQLGAWGLC
jgi:endonuclease YncB( thermonuclease family)